MPKSEEDPDKPVHSILFNCEAEINIRILGPIGLYGMGKYLYAKSGIIDFNEFIVLLGLTINFGF